MAKERYNLIFKGAIIEGAVLADVKKNLAALFKKDAAAIESLFDGKPKIIKRDIDLETCRKIAGTLKKAGAKCSAVKVTADTLHSKAQKKEAPSKQTRKKVTDERIAQGKEKRGHVEETARESLKIIKQKVKQIDIDQHKERVGAAITKASKIVGNVNPADLKGKFKRPMILVLSGVVLVVVLLWTLMGGDEDESKKMVAKPVAPMSKSKENGARPDRDTMPNTSVSQSNQQPSNLVPLTGKKVDIVKPKTTSKAVLAAAKIELQLDKTPITPPACQKLKSFPLKGIAYKDYNPVLAEYFGKPLMHWTEQDFDIFIAAFVDCREKRDDFFSNYNKKYFPQEVERETRALKSKVPDEKDKQKSMIAYNRLMTEVDPLSEQAKALTISEEGVARLREIQIDARKYYNDHNRRGDSLISLTDSIESTLTRYKGDMHTKKVKEDFAKEQAAEEARRQADLAKQAAEAKKLLKKYGRIGPPEGFLTSQFSTYAGSAESGHMGTVIKFYDQLKGSRKWEKQGDAWVLYHKFKDEVSGERHKILYAFYDLRANQGDAWLARVLVDGEDYPTPELIYLAMRIMGE
jgi:hypothetical protein